MLKPEVKHFAPPEFAARCFSHGLTFDEIAGAVITHSNTRTMRECHDHVIEESWCEFEFRERGDDAREETSFGHCDEWANRDCVRPQVARMFLDGHLAVCRKTNISLRWRLWALTRGAGIPDVIEDGRQGCLVPPSDPEAFAQAIDRLLSDPLQRIAMGVAARKRATQLFSLKEMQSSYVDWFDQTRAAVIDSLPSGLRTC